VTQKQVKQLQSGDEVYWNDPDETCSRILKIHSIEVHGDVAVIQEVSGAVVECFIKELTEASDDEGRG